MIIKTYTDEQIFAHPKILNRLYQLTNQGDPHDYCSGSALRVDLNIKRSGQFFLAWQSGKIIAWALLNRSVFGIYQIGVYVEPRHRRKGIGAKLCERVKKFASKTGEVVVFQDELDGMGIDMYKKAGFSFEYRCTG